MNIDEKLYLNYNKNGDETSVYAITNGVVTFYRYYEDDKLVYDIASKDAFIEKLKARHVKKSIIKNIEDYDEDAKMELARGTK